MNFKRYVNDKEKENGNMKRVSLNTAIRIIFSESDENFEGAHLIEAYGPPW